MTGWMLSHPVPPRVCTGCGILATRCFTTPHPDVLLFVHDDAQLLHQAPTAPAPGGVRTLCWQCNEPCPGHTHRHVGAARMFSTARDGEFATVSVPMPCPRCKTGGQLPGMVIPV